SGMDGLDGGEVEQLGQMEQPRHRQPGCASFMSRIDLVMNPDHRADLFAVELLRIALLPQEPAEIVLHCRKADDAVEPRLPIDRLLYCGVRRFNEAVPLDISLDIL